MDKQKKLELEPLDIARETFKQMAMRRVVPTPDNYRLIYNELAGISVKDDFDNAFRKALKKLPKETTEQINWFNRWEKLFKQGNWSELPELLNIVMDNSITLSTQWPDAIRELLQSWDAKQVGLDIARKKEALERVLINYGSEPSLVNKIQALASNWKEYKVNETSTLNIIESVDKSLLPSKDIPVINEEIIKSLPESLPVASVSVGYENDQFQETFRALQDMLKQALNYGLIPRLEGYPDLKIEATQILLATEKAHKLKDWQTTAKKFRAFLVRVEVIGANENDMKQDLLRLLKLLIDNISELVSDDQWLRGQVAVVQTIITSPLDRSLIEDAEKSLKEVIFKQGMLKLSLVEAKNAFKTMIATFVDRLGYMSTSTDAYQEKVDYYAKKLAEAEDIAQINILLENLMKDTHAMQTDIVRSREVMIQHTDAVNFAQEKILKLQAELSQLSEQVSIDQLTGVLNRRGLDEAIEKEISRVQRGNSKLCIALLDIDNFKNFNDNYGHQVGDDALQHFARVIQETLRPTDIAARFGGEEFVILLPDTNIIQAVEVISRLQRTLTKQFFLGNNERLLITFSAGISAYKENEDKVAVLNRADQAMYLAKNSGRNRVMTELDITIRNDF